MSDTALERAVDRFVSVTRGADEANLARVWDWKGYSDGVRFAFFRTAEELWELAVRCAVARDVQGSPPTEAQRILARYHAAFRDLWAALDGLDARAVDQVPAADEWAIRTALGHMIGADAGFLVVIGYALEQHRHGNNAPGTPPEEYWLAVLGDKESFDAALSAPLADVRTFHEALHNRIIDTLKTISAAEVELPSQYWERDSLPLRFRLHRLESHLRQHTIQVDKTLAAIGRAPIESQRLARMLYAGLASVEGTNIGAEQSLAAEHAILAATIGARADEIAALPD